MILKVGDKVSVINEPIVGIVVKIQKNEVFIETKDGFRLSYLKNELVVYKYDLDTAQLFKINTEIHTKSKSMPAKQKQKAQTVVDLHYEGEKNISQPIIKIQLAKFKTELNLAIKARLPEITFIHGFGEGKLKNEIEKILWKNNITFSEASFAKYGEKSAILVFLQGIKNPI